MYWTWVVRPRRGERTAYSLLTVSFSQITGSGLFQADGETRLQFRQLGFLPFKQTQPGA